MNLLNSTKITKNNFVLRNQKTSQKGKMTVAEEISDARALGFYILTVISDSNSEKVQLNIEKN